MTNKTISKARMDAIAHKIKANPQPEQGRHIPATVLIISSAEYQAYWETLSRTAQAWFSRVCWHGFYGQLFKVIGS